MSSSVGNATRGVRFSWRSPRRSHHLSEIPLHASASSSNTNGVTPPIICFLASHVASKHRLADLERTVQSILAQRPKLPPLSVSWSSTPELAPHVRAIFDAAASALTVTSVEQPSKTSQFEHYRALASLHAPKPPMWVLFSDDDDIWDEHRYGLYWEQARLAARSTPNAAALLCRRKCLARHGAIEPRDAEGVRRLMRARHARYSDCNLKDGLEEDEHNMAEYFDAAVRFSVVSQFFESVPRFMTRHRLCDLAFCFLIQKQPTTVRWMPEGQRDFVYFYSRGTRPEGASAVTPTEEDIHVARTHFGRSPPTVQQLFIDAGGGDVDDDKWRGMVTSFVACLRQGLEQELIQIRATGRVVPRHLVLAACAHQAAKNVDSWAISHPEMHASRAPELAAWARGLACGPMCESLLCRFEFEALIETSTWTVELINPSGAWPGGTCEGRVFADGLGRRRRMAEEVLRDECDLVSGRVGMWKGKP